KASGRGEPPPNRGNSPKEVSARPGHPPSSIFPRPSPRLVGSLALPKRPARSSWFIIRSRCTFTASPRRRILPGTMSQTPAATQESLVQDLHHAGIAAGDAVIVHSSMRSLGPVEGGADAVIDALLAAVGPRGTVLMPVFSNPSPSGEFVVAETPSRVGFLTEAFRRRPEVKRSWHPTHSVAAAGAHVEWLEHHEKTSGLGPASPMHRAAEAGAKILMIGCPITTCSAIHIAEAILPVPYLGKVGYPGYGRTLTTVTPVV